MTERGRMKEVDADREREPPPVDPARPHICETCGRKLGPGDGICLEQDMIARLELEDLPVVDHTHLRFCSKKCQGRWAAMRQGAVWNEHGDGCMCAACFR